MTISSNNLSIAKRKAEERLEVCLYLEQYSADNESLIFPSRFSDESISDIVASVVMEADGGNNEPRIIPLPTLSQKLVLF